MYERQSIIHTNYSILPGPQQLHGSQIVFAHILGDLRWLAQPLLNLHEQKRKQIRTDIRQGDEDHGNERKTLHYEYYVKTLDGATMQQDMCRTRTFGSTSVRQLVSCFSRVVPTSFRSAVDNLMTLKSLWLLPGG